MTATTISLIAFTISFVGLMIWIRSEIHTLINETKDIHYELYKLNVTTDHISDIADDMDTTADHPIGWVYEKDIENKRNFLNNKK